jgi:hypothetical protein
MTSLVSLKRIVTAVRDHFDRAGIEYALVTP